MIITGIPCSAIEKRLDDLTVNIHAIKPLAGVFPFGFMAVIREQNPYNRPTTQTVIKIAVLTESAST